MAYEVTHMPELIEAVEEWNTVGDPIFRMNADEFREYETASEAVKDLEGLEMEEEAALEYLLDSTMILEINGKIIANIIY